MNPGPLSPPKAETPVLAQGQAAGTSSTATPAQLRVVRWTTASWCAALVVVAMVIHYRQETHLAGASNSPWLLLHRQDKILGLAAIALALMTLPLGVFYGRGFAARMRIAQQARAMHMAVSLSALATIVLHIVALWSASALSTYNANALLIPFSYPDDSRFPHPIAAGVLGFWIIAIFGLSYFVRKPLGGIARWRIVHRFVLAGLALAALHSLYLSGPIPGYSP